MASSAALLACAKAGERAVSAQLLQSLQGLQVEPAAAAFNAASSGSCWEEGLEFLLWGEHLGVAASTASASAKLKALERGGQWRSILALVGRMKQAPPNTPQPMPKSLMTACREASEWARSLALLEAQPLKLSASAFISAMSSQGWRTALCTLDRLKAVRAADAFSYNAAIKQCEASGSWECALCLLKEMKEQHLDVDMLTYHMVMTAQMNSMLWAECLATLQAMEVADTDDLGPLAYGPAVGVCLRTLQWESALLIVQRLHVRRHMADVAMMNSCITACERAGHWLLALQVYWRMRESGPTLGGPNEAQNSGVRYPIPL